VDPYAWTWNPEGLAVLLLTAGYVIAISRYPAAFWRIACFALAVVLLLAVSVSPLHMLAMMYLLTVHLFQNVVLAEWAPLLIVVAIPPAMAAAIARPPIVRTLTHPALTLPLWLANYMIWHLPWVYDAALEHPNSLLHLEHACYFLTGLGLWWSIIQDEPHRLPAGRRAAIVFAAFVLASPIGLVLALIPKAIYSVYVDAPQRLWGLTPLADQQVAGLLMALEQAIVFFAIFAVWFVRFFEEEERREEIEHSPEAA
jgi:cytochrome c oxidase assembly factor CtaG